MVLRISKSKKLMIMFYINIYLVYVTIANDNIISVQLNWEINKKIQETNSIYYHNIWKTKMIRMIVYYV
jgi:hypothetical protein